MKAGSTAGATEPGYGHVGSRAGGPWYRDAEARGEVLVLRVPDNTCVHRDRHLHSSDEELGYKQMS